MPPDNPQQPPVEPTGPHPPAYDFIMNPQKPPKPPKLAGITNGANSFIVRAGIIAGGLLGLLIIFVIAKNLLFKGPDLSAYVTIAQDQQELIHLASGVTTGNQAQGLSSSNLNLAATINIALSSNQAQIVSYLATNHKKVNQKTLNLKVSTSLDTELTTAQSAGTYDPTFQGILQSQLNTYANDLKRVYQQSSGKKGRALLSSDYKQAVLMLSQANAPATNS